MRVTNSMMINQLMKNLNRNLKRMETQQYQIATGRRIGRPSEDPVGITRSLQARTELSKIDQYLKNVQDAKAWMIQGETALMEMNEITLRAYELAQDGANGSKTPEDRQAIAKEIDQLKQQLLETANTTYAGRSIFGGYNTTGDKPFKVEKDPDNDNLYVWYNGEKISNLTDPTDQPSIPSDFGMDKIEYEIGLGTIMDISMPGTQVFGVGQDNMYGVLHELYEALNDGTDQERITQCIGRLQDQQQEILANVAEIGGKFNRLELIESRFKDDRLNYKGVQSSVEDIDQEQVIMEFKMAEAVYRFSLGVGARIIQPSLLDFLR